VRHFSSATRRTFQPPFTVVHKLIDIVSKNGCLLLNMPQRADGTLDDKEIAFLQEMAAWTQVNGEAIYATRPWFTFGEGDGPVPPADKKSKGDVYQPGDFRFTRSKDGKILYAIAMAWPTDGKLLVKSLATGAEKISEVSLLGNPGKLDWQQTAAGLVVTMPKEKPCNFAYSLKIVGENLKPASVLLK
jgi:alpha-L-fucosidase